MRLIPSIRGSFVIAGLLFATHAFADRNIAEFEEDGRTMSAEEIAAAKAQIRTNVAVYGEELAEPAKPFPWMMVLLCATTIVIAAPFAMRMYRRTAAETENANAFGFKGGKAE